MAAFDKTANEENSAKQAVAEDFANFLKSKKLNDISLILLDVFFPFQRQVKALLSVFEPLSGFLFGPDVSEKMNFFSSEDSSFDTLREALERGRK